MFNKMGVDGEPSPQDVREWLIDAKEGDMKKTTISQYTSILTTYWKTLGLDGLDEVNNIIDMIKPSISTSDYGRGQLTKKQLGKIIEVSVTPFDLMFELGYCYARRLGEVRRLSKDMVGGGEVTFPILKKETVREVTFSFDLLPDEWVDTLREVREQAEGEFEVEPRAALREGEVIEEPLFPFKSNQIQYRFKKAAEHVGKFKGIEQVPEDSRNFHALRHSRVIHLRNEGVNWDVIRELTRHEQLSTLQDTYGRPKRKTDWEGKIPPSDV